MHSRSPNKWYTSKTRQKCTNVHYTSCHTSHENVQFSTNASQTCVNNTWSLSHVVCIRLSISGWLNTQGYDLFMLVISRLCQLRTMHKQQWGGKRQEIFWCFLVHLLCFSDLSCCCACVRVRICLPNRVSLVFPFISSYLHSDSRFSRAARTIVVRNNFANVG